MPLLEKARKYYHKHKLGRLFDTMEKDARYTIFIDAEAKGNSPPIGCSRIGGEPDLPKGMQWPTSDNHSMAFVAQLNLKELHERAPSLSELPKEGILFFFRQDNEDIDNYGLDVEDFIHTKVIHYTGNFAALERHPFPDDLEAYEKYQPALCNFLESLTIPEEFSPWWNDDLEITDEESDQYYDHIYGEYDAQILGHPSYVQGAVETDAVEGVSETETLSSLPNDLQEKLAAPFGRDEKDWRLLLSISSIDACDMMWGDMGSIYFMITHDDLKKQRFDRITCIFQCG